MLVITRNKNTFIFLYEKSTRKLIGKIAAVDLNGVHTKLGLEFENNVGIVRQELTTLSHLSFSETQKLPLGTLIE